MTEEIDYEALPANAGFAVNMLAGALAGISEHAVMFPIDSIKTRMQVFATSPVAVYSGVGNAFTRISSTEGLRALWRGVSSVALGAGPAHAVHFGTLEAVKELAGGNEAGNQWLATSLAGASATIASDALMNPFDVVKQRMQVHKSEFRSVFTCARTVFRTEGIGAFYVSYPTTLAISIPFNAIQFTVYEQLKRFLNPTHKYSPTTHIVSGAVAGAVAAAVTTPLDVAKTILQTRGTSPDADIRNCRGMMDAIRTPTISSLFLTMAKSKKQHPAQLRKPVSVVIPPSSTPSPLTPTTPKTPADEGIEFFETQIRLGDPPINVYELRLDTDGGPHKDSSYIRLPPAYVPYILRVSIDAGTPAARNGVFKTNFPLDGGVFGRDRFAERKLPTDYSKPIHVDLPISHAGAFIFWIEYDGEISGERIKGRAGYFNIDPHLKIKARSPILDPKFSSPLSPETGGAAVSKDQYVNLPLNGLAILTVVSKWMGPISNWENHFKEASQRGYTMLHWTPLQERGESGSPYSLRDQLKFDPIVSSNPAEIEEILKMAREKYGLLSLTDVVLNHTANDSPWLIEHPEAGASTLSYIPANSPHLMPALEFDTAMIEFSASLAQKGLPTSVKSTADIDTLLAAFNTAIQRLNFWQYYVLDVSRERKIVMDALTSGKYAPWSGPDVVGKTIAELAQIVRDRGIIKGLGAFSSRFCVKVDAVASAGMLKAAFPQITNLDSLADNWVQVVDVINVPLYEEWTEDTRVAMDNIQSRLKYTRLDEHGPKLGEITKLTPLVEPYFTRLAPSESNPLVYSLANNGWIWNADPLQNFALPPSKAYLRREVIVWGDCVKLRYGSSPSANPWLWDHMTKYVTSLARIFEGFRIDNCHSTPLEVGTVMLDAARVVRPDLYVCAELFTGSEDMDLVFVRELGINSLIRESGNAPDPKELSRLIYRHGVGKPVGSMDSACMSTLEELPSPTGKGPVRPCIVSPLNGTLPHALFYDLTHDNESPLDKRSGEDALSTGALVAFSYCAVGSVKGFDDLYPKLLNLVSETRLYEVTGLGEGSGISTVRRVLNNLHLEMVLGQFEEGHVHQENDYIAIHRVQPTTQKGYLLVAHTAFSKGSKDRGFMSPMKLRRTRAKFILGASIDISSYEAPNSTKTLQGMPSRLLDMPPVVVPQGLDSEGPYSEIIVPENFPPGSIMVFETQMQDFDASIDEYCSQGVQDFFDSLDLVDLNVVLYRADGEERDATNGKFGAYEVPGLGKLVYCGLEGWMHSLRHIMRYNDLGHPLCAHLREGSWALDYVHNRLKQQTENLPKLAKPAQWFKDRFERVSSSVPNFMRPKYFALVISTAYKAARRAAIEQSSDFVASGDAFTHDLALCAVQLHGLVKSASLDPSAPTPSLAAGLPHFAAGWARCWGRDVFISLRGLFLTTGNFEGAKKHILAFSSTLKHGLIPNLLDSVRNPRYNSRDSPWWMLQNIQDYVLSAPDGLSLLSEAVKRRFPQDDTWVTWNDPRAYAYSSTVAEIIQEILQRHADGIRFREYNAGSNLDMQMKDEGFEIDIHVDWKTGFVFGGNQYNCGTWMDKMGESTKAGTKGIPGSPRDGAPVEIVGLVKSALTWVAGLSAKGKFPFKGVKAIIDGQTKLVTYKEWADLIQASFEKYYYVPASKPLFYLSCLKNSSEDAHYVINSSLVNRRGIYKDVYGSGLGREWSDYQFRPNFAIAMTVAPELFDQKRAMGALKLADEVLRGPIGMKTLDPKDLQYRPNYDNSNDSTDPAVAKGQNYHNGPEWGWPLGYFLRAYLHFANAEGSGEQEQTTKTLYHLYKILLVPREHIRKDIWAGIPELTNADGQTCNDSCNTQAWSASTLLDFLETHDLEQEKQKFKISAAAPSEDLAVYTWGEESYDGLGDLLQEGQDDFNDETFGDDGVVGKDFDFSSPAFPDAIRDSKSQPLLVKEEPVHPVPSKQSRPTANSLEAIWDDKSPFSVLHRNNPGRSIHELRRQSPAASSFSPFMADQQAPAHPSAPVKPGVRTLQELEAEMRATAQQSRQRQLEQQQLLLRQQEEEAMQILQLQRERERQQLMQQQQQERELERQQVLQYQEQQHQLQLQRALLLQQQMEQRMQRTPPPRMLPGVSPSPRFLEHQRQMILLQQQQEQQQRLQELQEQLRYEELERQMLARTRQTNHSPSQFTQSRHPSGPIPSDLQTHLVLQQQQLQQHNLRQRSRSPAVSTNYTGSVSESLPYVSQNIQMQQRSISDLAQADMLRELHASSPAEQEAVRHEAMRKILEAERMEEKRRRKAAKIAHMARYNDLMTQSDKDFITRIQVSQLVTQDPYSDDFYAQVYGAILRSRMGIQARDDRVLKFTSGGGVGLGLAQKPGSRRPNAMLRMEQQVERIVSNARKREEEKGHSLPNLQGALGKTSGRSYKAAPRQLLQVDAGASPTLSPGHAHIGKDNLQKAQEGAAEEAAKLGREALGTSGDTDGLVRKEPLSHRQILVAVESLYDTVLKTENIKRSEPSPEDGPETMAGWKSEYDASVDLLWNGLKVMVPLETSNPHPFISLLIPSKGKRILPRATRHLSHDRMYTLLTLLVACFDQLDVVKSAYILDSLDDTKERAEAERQSEAFLLGVLHSILPVVARAELKLVTGLLGLLLDRTNIVQIAQSGAGIALLTLFLSRVEVIKQALTSGVELAETPTPEEAVQWKSMFDHLFHFLAPHLLSLFPSNRMAAQLPAGHSKPLDHADQPVWQLLAALALHASVEQQSILVTTLREKVLEIVYRVNKGWITDEDERQTKLSNVNLFLHALGLDSSQIAL
ncbi:hypothetical protein H0H93_016689 [Arthromyces matolae]|nr:hypothetical protein H0H93_016689 [Arthromyces matolae]